MTGVKSGQKFIDTIDVNSPEYVREQYRPVEVKQDVRQMAERKRVNEILKSRQFRDELEDVVVEKSKCSSPSKASIIALQQASELLLPQARLQHGAVFGRIETPIIPINDLAEDATTVNLEKGERLLRCKLTCCYRLIDQYHWSQSPHPTYISAKVNENDFLISPGAVPAGILSAKQLIKLNQEGHSISGSSGVDSITSTLHAAAYLAEERVKSVLLLRSNTAVMMGSLDTGLLPLSHDAIILGKVPTVTLNDQQEVTEQLADVFKVANKAVLLKGIGALVFGESIEEVFMDGKKLMATIDVQLRTAPLGLDNLVLPSEEVQKKIVQLALKKQRKNEIEFEALMRHLENAGHKTGYPFREILFRKVENKANKVNSEVELPPTSVSIGYLEEDDDRPRQCRPSGKFTEWLNSPMAYLKEEVEVPTCTPQNKKITRWVPDSSPAGTLIKIDNPNQFVPVGTDPNEVKAKVKQIRREYYDENITSGPQSKILTGLTWEEAQKIKSGNVSSDTVITVGAASRGIIQKGHQNQGSLYRTYYAPNPFDSMTEEEVQAYKLEVDKKSGKSSTGVTTESSMVQYDDDEDNIVPGPDGQLISTDERLQQIKQHQQHPPPVDTPQVVPTATTTTAAAAAVPTAPVHVNGETIEKPLKSPTSPTKSTSSGDATAPEVLSGNDDKGESDSGADKKKKKKGFRMPSFSSKKKDKKDK
ncbi:hypothetical protein HELRODRAFT_185073 [Helobdella robusta]|uniref:Class II aldolase/adducin N-terminal domain-containing protein n=1 Tax=Helobdella robusta TaxID=6412 RepID=T1FMD1_HELRO|nr:hypothetical protein HELRODRAFT_185073 [Helobdella robusta]ESN96222.1 hypothetical protein HELRODRAFT_185073 [Helobdella robusta]